MSDLFETRVENLEPKEDKKNFQQLPRNPRIRSPPKKRKRVGFDVRVVKLSGESSLEHRPVRMYCILYWKCRLTTDNCKNLCAMVDKHKKEEKEMFQVLRNKQQQAKCANWEEISEIRQEQEKEEDRKRASVFPRKSTVRW